MGTRTIPAVAIAGIIGLLAGATGFWLLDDDGRPNADDSSIAPSILSAPDGTVLAAGLEHPTSCDDLAATMQALQDEYGSTFGFGGGRMAVEETADMMMDDSGGGDQGTTAAPMPSEADSAAADGGLDTTNVQEIGVDEPDIVERLSQDVVVVGTEGTIRVLDVSGATPVARGDLAVQEWGGDLGLFRISETRVAVLANGEGLVREDLATSMIRPGGWGTTVVTLIDVSDLDAPREVSRMEVEGWLVDARAVDGILRLAVRSEGPQIDVYAAGEFPIEREMDWENATQEDYERFDREYQAEYERRMDEALAQLEPAHWQPHADVDGRTVPLVGCDRIGFPTSFAGMGTLTLAAIDATGDSLAIDDSEAVVTSGENLYATTDRVVIATTRWNVDPVPMPGPVDDPPAEEPVFEPGEEAPAPPPVEEEPAPEPVEPDVPEETEPTEEVEVETLPMIAPPWMGWGGVTDLHVFDVEGTLVSHVASGSVDGNLPPTLGPAPGNQRPDPGAQPVPPPPRHPSTWLAHARPCRALRSASSPGAPERRRRHSSWSCPPPCAPPSVRAPSRRSRGCVPMPRRPPPHRRASRPASALPPAAPDLCRSRRRRRGRPRASQASSRRTTARRRRSRAAAARGAAQAVRRSSGCPRPPSPP